MKDRLPLTFVLAGTAMVIVGGIISVVLVVRNVGCTGVLPNSVCQGYIATSRWSGLLAVLGAAMIVGAGISAKYEIKRNRAH